MLEAVRGATTIPWEAHEARVNATIFPQMANWLPQAEADALRAAFAAELARLGLHTERRGPG